MAEGGDTAAFVALIGDIRGSRELADRHAAQEAFKKVVESLNEEISSDSIASPFTVTAGDEFQVLLTDASAGVGAAVKASERFQPAKLRFGIGRGKLETEVNPDQAIGMDGPCFHRARDAIDAARQEQAWIRISGWASDRDRQINSLFDLVQCVREDWTDRQAQFARALKEEGAQKRVAARYEVSKSTVSESLSAGHVQEVHTAEESLGALLQGPDERP